jgi:hypothetical protein
MGGVLSSKKNDTQDVDIARRANDALRRALNTPPKQHKEIKKERKKRQDEDHPTASGSGSGKRT